MNFSILEEFLDDLNSKSNLKPFHQEKGWIVLFQI